MIDFNGRQLLLVFERSRAAGGISYLPAWIGLAAGVIMSALLFALMLSLINRRDRAATLAALSDTLAACTGCHARFRQDVVDHDRFVALTGGEAPHHH